jgi:hypothetical protein
MKLTDEQAAKVREKHANGWSVHKTSRRWGIGIKRDDGTVAIEPDPWDR